MDGGLGAQQDIFIVITYSHHIRCLAVWRVVLNLPCIYCGCIKELQKHQVCRNTDQDPPGTGRGEFANLTWDLEKWPHKLWGGIQREERRGREGRRHGGGQGEDRCTRLARGAGHKGSDDDASGAGGKGRGGGLDGPELGRGAQGGLCELLRGRPGDG